MLLNNLAAFCGTNTSPTVRQMEAVHQICTRAVSCGKDSPKTVQKGFNSNRSSDDAELHYLGIAHLCLHAGTVALLPPKSRPGNDRIPQQRFVPGKEEDSSPKPEHSQVPTSHLGLLQKRCLSTTPPPQLREQGERGLQADQCPWTTAMGFSSSRELH